MIVSCIHSHNCLLFSSGVLLSTLLRIGCSLYSCHDHMTLNGPRITKTDPEDPEDPRRSSRVKVSSLGGGWDHRDVLARSLFVIPA